MGNRWISRIDRRMIALAVSAVVALAGGAAAMSASASTGTVPGSDAAAAVQTVLDRVLGPGNAVVAVSDTVVTSAGTTTTQQYGSGVARAVSVATQSTSGASSRTTAQQNAVGMTTTTTTAPAGSLVRRTVSVAVDSAHLGGRSLAALRRIASSAAGVVGSRGDRFSLIATRFARPAAVVAPSPSPVAMVLPYVPQLLWVLGAVLALAVLAAAVRGRRRPA